MCLQAEEHIRLYRVPATPYSSQYFRDLLFKTRHQLLRYVLCYTGKKEIISIQGLHVHPVLFSGEIDIFPLEQLHSFKIFTLHLGVLIKYFLYIFYVILDLFVICSSNSLIFMLDS